MIEEILSKTKDAMNGAIDVLKKDFISIRSGKVSTNILDHVNVNYYDNPTPLNQVASVLATDATTITISPWEKNLLGDIEKALQGSNLGVNPNNDGDVIKLFFPPMTTEQREESVKEAKVMSENAKVAIRNVRKHSNNQIKSFEKEKDITEDESKSAQDSIQKITDDFTKTVDTMLKDKEDQLLKI